MTFYDNPNQQTVRPDGSGPGYPASAAWSLPAPSVAALVVTLALPAPVKAASVQVSWGDGTSDYWGDPEGAPGTGPQPTHTYAAPGTYLVLADPFADTFVAREARVTVSGGAAAPAPEGGDEEVEPYDPSEHTIADVQAYIEANPDDTQRVLDAEIAGKNRTTLVDWLSADG